MRIEEVSRNKKQMLRLLGVQVSILDTQRTSAGNYCKKVCTDKIHLKEIKAVVQYAEDICIVG